MRLPKQNVPINRTVRTVTKTGLLPADDCVEQCMKEKCGDRTDPGDYLTCKQNARPVCEQKCYG